MTRLLYAVGTALAAWGGYGLVTAEASAPLSWARFAALVVLVNDGLLAPVVLAGGVLLVRWAPPAARAYLQAGLFVSGAVTLLALPFVLGVGRTADVPSALPLNYGRGLVLTLLVGWAGVGAVALVNRRAGSGGARPAPPHPR